MLIVSLPTRLKLKYTLNPYIVFRFHMIKNKINRDKVITVNFTKDVHDDYSTNYYCGLRTARFMSTYHILSHVKFRDRLNFNIKESLSNQYYNYTKYNTIFKEIKRSCYAGKEY